MRASLTRQGGTPGHAVESRNTRGYRLRRVEPVATLHVLAVIVPDPMPSPRVTLALLVALAAGLSACDTGDGRTLTDPAPGATAPPQPGDITSTSGAILANPPVGSGEIGTMTLGSSAFAAGEPIPEQFTCEGANTSPPLSWTGIPAEAVELALTVVDTDAAAGQFVHWVVTGLPPAVLSIDAGADVTVDGAIEARNDTTEFGWYGPCPPAGETHRYVFTLYALERALGRRDRRQWRRRHRPALGGHGEHGHAHRHVHVALTRATLRDQRVPNSQPTGSSPRYSLRIRRAVVLTCTSSGPS